MVQSQILITFVGKKLHFVLMFFFFFFLYIPPLIYALDAKEDARDAFPQLSFSVFLPLLDDCFCVIFSWKGKLVTNDFANWG